MQVEHKNKKRKESQESVTAERIKMLAYLIFLAKMIPSLLPVLVLYIQLVLTPSYKDVGTMFGDIQTDLARQREVSQNANNSLGYNIINSDGTININAEKIEAYIRENGIDSFTYLVQQLNSQFISLAYHQDLEGLIDHGQFATVDNLDRSNPTQIIENYVEAPTEVNIDEVLSWLELENENIKQWIAISRFEQLNINYYDIIFRLLATLIVAGMLTGNLNRERKRMYRKLLKRLQKKTSFVVLSGVKTEVIEPFESRYTKEDERAAVESIEDKQIDAEEPYGDLTKLVTQKVVQPK
jgi:hypothetical protein